MATCKVCGASVPAVIGHCHECESETGLVDYPEVPVGGTTSMLRN